MSVLHVSSPLGRQCRRTGAIALGVALLGALAMGGCETTKKDSDAASESSMNRSQQRAARVSSESLRSRLGTISPQIDRTIAAMSEATATGQPAAINAYASALSTLRSDVESVIQATDEIRRLGFDGYFLESGRTVASAGEPGVVEARDRFGLVGDYFVDLRRQSRAVLGDLTTVADKLGADPASHASPEVQEAAGRIYRDRIPLEGTISALIAEWDRVVASR